MLKRTSDTVRALRAVIRIYANNGIIISLFRTNQGEESGRHNERASNSKEEGRMGDDFRPGLPVKGKKKRRAALAWPCCFCMNMGK